MYFGCLLQGCKVTLSDYSKPTQDIADALCTILILEDKTPRQVFQDFLILRMVSIMSLQSYLPSTHSLLRRTNIAVLGTNCIVLCGLKI